uniref:Uncharacterized protein n=1 Tax=Echeneis naucrates TaxID=173247 RepID=A0A665XCR0_ECHNA
SSGRASVQEAPDSFGMLDGLEEDRSSCSTESSGGSGASSPGGQEEEGGGVNVCVCACLCLSATCEIVSCSRSYSSNSKKASILAETGKPPTKKAKVLQKQPLMTKLAQRGSGPIRREDQVFDWGRYLGDGDVTGAPVSCFKHVGRGATSVKDFWLNLVRPRYPPGRAGVAAGGETAAILHRISNWKTFLIKRLTGSKTLPPDFTTKVQESMQFPFKKQMRLEVVDKTHLCRTRVALVERWDSCSSGECDDGTDDFCVTCTVPLIHSIGWSRSIGHRFKRSGESAPEEPSVSVLSDRDPTGAGSPGVTQSVLFQMLSKKLDGQVDAQDSFC